MNSLSDAITRHQLFIQRYAAGEFKAALPALKQMARDIEATISRADITEFQYSRAMSLQFELTQIIGGAISGVQNQLSLNLSEFAEYETKFTERMMGGFVSVKMATVPEAEVNAIATTSVMELVSGDKVITQTLPKAFEKFAGTASREVATLINAGILESKTTREIANDVRGLVDNRTLAQAESLILTAANMVGTKARDEFYQANADVLSGEEWVSTLDGRTSPVCRARDGKIYPVGQGPKPPAHYRCRSVRVPIIKEEYRLDFDGTRSSMDGPVSDKTTYNSFLKRQSAEFQDEVLGPARGKLFRSGGLPMDRFVDDRGITYTLAELRALEPMAFAKAGL